MTYRPPSRCKLKQAFAFLLFAAALFLSSCGTVDFQIATEATVSLPVVLDEAERITGRLMQANLVTEKEFVVLNTHLRAVRDGTGAFSGEVRRGIAGEEPDAEKNRQALVEDFERMFNEVENLKLAVSSLDNANARESYRVVLSMIDGDVGKVATALGCKKINPNCVSCSEGRLDCKK